MWSPFFILVVNRYWLKVYKNSTTVSVEAPLGDEWWGGPWWEISFHLALNATCRWCPPRRCQHPVTPSLFIYLFVAVLGLDCCSGFSLAAASEDYSPVAVQWLLLLQSSTQASEAAEHGLSCSSRILGHRLRSGGAWTQLLHSIQDLPGPRIEPVSPHWQADSLPLSHQGSPCKPF